jgi:hypothetical protein
MMKRLMWDFLKAYQKSKYIIELFTGVAGDVQRRVKLIPSCTKRETEKKGLFICKKKASSYLFFFIISGQTL